MVDGMGGINLSNAKLVCETLGYAWDDEMMIKILGAVSAYLEVKRQEK